MTREKALTIHAAELRRALTTMIYSARTGHIGGSLSSADIITVLYFDLMNIDSQNPKMAERDRFVLSKGHSVEAYYAALAAKGFFSSEELGSFSRYQSRLIGHPNNKVPGVEMSTGALGHGLPIGVGMALAGKMDKARYKVYVLMGDGEQAEGSIWEAAMAGAKYGLDNLVGIVDRNGLQISGSTEQVMPLEDFAGKWRAFGWHVIVADGNSIPGLLEAFSEPWPKGKPRLILANTVKGKGISFMENKKQWHHGVLNDEQYAQAMRELDKALEEAKRA